MSEMFDSYNNLPQDYKPNNLPVVECCKNEYYATIIRGTTPRHIFELPIEFMPTEENKIIRELSLTYVQCLDVVLEKTMSRDLTWVEDKERGKALLYVDLTQKETYLFEVTNPNNLVQCQIKLLLSGGEVFVTPIYYMNVLEVLNNDTYVLRGIEEDE